MTVHGPRVDLEPRGRVVGTVNPLTSSDQVFSSKQKDDDLCPVCLPGLRWPVTDAVTPRKASQPLSGLSHSPVVP